MSKVESWLGKMNRYYDTVDSDDFKEDMEMAGFHYTNHCEKELIIDQEVACSTEDEELIETKNNSVIAIKI